MRTFKAYFKKEVMESLRQYRYITLGAAVIIFAFADPVMLKLLPSILKNQLPGDISSLFNITPTYALANYIKDLVNIGNLFIIFSLGGILSEEIYGQKLVFPYSTGSRPAAIVLAKVLHYSFAIVIFTFIGFFTAYYYIGILIKGDNLIFSGVMKSYLLISLYYLYNITLVILLSSFVKKGIAAGFLVLAINFITMGGVKLKTIGKFMPYKLVEYANTMSLDHTGATMIAVLVMSIVFVVITIYRMNRIEVI